MTIAQTCDSCTNAASDEARCDLDADTAGMLLTEMGADILDHTWRKLQSPEEVAQ